MSFLSTFTDTLGVIVAIALVIIFFIWIRKKILAVRYAPLLRIYKGYTFIKETRVPKYERFRECLERLENDESMKLISRNPLYKHPLNEFFSEHCCPIAKNGGFPKLAGFKYPGTDSLYFTICDTFFEYVCVQLKFNRYFESGCGVTQEEYENLKNKDWWVVWTYRDMGTSYMIGVLKKTTLPVPNV